MLCSFGSSKNKTKYLLFSEKGVKFVSPNRRKLIFDTTGTYIWSNSVFSAVHCGRDAVTVVHAQHSPNENNRHGYNGNLLVGQLIICLVTVTKKGYLREITYI